MKQCSKCKRKLDKSEFDKDKAQKDGLHNQCKNCEKQYRQKHKKEIKQYQKQYHQEHKEERNQHTRQYHQTLPGRYVIYKTNAKNRNYEFKLSLFDFASIIIQSCYYCDKKDGIYNGIDRINNSKGYIKDNCVPCCKACNFMKKAQTKEKFITKCIQIANHFKNSKKVK